MNSISVLAHIDKTGKQQKVSLDENATVLKLLQTLKINPVTVIVSRNSELILETEKLNDNDELKILSVISGG